MTLVAKAFGPWRVGELGEQIVVGGEVTGRGKCPHAVGFNGRPDCRIAPHTGRAKRGTRRLWLAASSTAVRVTRVWSMVRASSSSNARTRAATGSGPNAAGVSRQPAIANAMRLATQTALLVTMRPTM